MATGAENIARCNNNALHIDDTLGLLSMGGKQRKRTALDTDFNLCQEAQPKRSRLQALLGVPARVLSGLGTHLDSVRRLVTVEPRAADCPSNTDICNQEQPHLVHDGRNQSSSIDYCPSALSASVSDIISANAIFARETDSPKHVVQCANQSIPHGLHIQQGIHVEGCSLEASREHAPSGVTCHPIATLASTSEQLVPPTSEGLRLVQPFVEHFSDLLQIHCEENMDFSATDFIDVKLKNMSTCSVAFKWKASSAHCLARPSSGALRPDGVQDVRLSLHSAIHGKPIKAQYLVQAVLVQSPAALSRDEWARIKNEFVYEFRLPIVRSVAASASYIPLLRVDPGQEFCFVRTDSGAEAWLTLHSMSRSIVAFRFQATAPNMFIVQPSTGWLAPYAQIRVCVRLVQPVARASEGALLLQMAPFQSAEVVNFDTWAALPPGLLQKQWLQGRIVQ